MCERDRERERESLLMWRFMFSPLTKILDFSTPSVFLYTTKWGDLGFDTNWFSCCFSRLLINLLSSSQNFGLFHSVCILVHPPFPEKFCKPFALWINLCFQDYDPLEIQLSMMMSVNFNVSLENYLLISENIDLSCVLMLS